MIEGTATLLLAALILDAVLGEPNWIWSRLPHPVVLFGRVIGWADDRFNTGLNRKVRGTLVVMTLSVAALCAGFAISALPLGWLWSVLIGAVLLAQRSLTQHVRAVADALRRSLADGRMAVSMIVGRDTVELQEPEVSRAAIESAAENLSDGVIAPAFWFLLLGLPGLLLYKVVNTADSMIGHRTERHEAFGWAAARLDDILNWVPARLTALLIALTHPGAGAWQIAWRDARHHRSPNAGWPEAAMSAVLNLSLAGPRRYHGALTDYPWINPVGRRDAGPAEIEAAVRVLWRVWAAAFLLTAIFTIV